MNLSFPISNTFNLKIEAERYNETSRTSLLGNLQVNCHSRIFKYYLSTDYNLDPMHLSIILGSSSAIPLPLYLDRVALRMIQETGTKEPKLKIGTNSFVMSRSFLGN